MLIKSYMKQESLGMFLTCCLTTTITDVNKTIFSAWNVMENDSILMEFLQLSAQIISHNVKTNDSLCVASKTAADNWQQLPQLSLIQCG